MAIALFLCRVTQSRRDTAGYTDEEGGGGECSAGDCLHEILREARRRVYFAPVGMICSGV